RAFAKREREAFADAVVVERENIRTAQTEHQKHFDGPATYPADRREAFDDGVVVHRVDFSQRWELACLHLLGEIFQRQNFRSRQPGTAQLRSGGTEYTVRGESLVRVREEGADPGVDGRRGFARELLVHDGFGKRRKDARRPFQLHSEGADGIDET